MRFMVAFFGETGTNEKTYHRVGFNGNKSAAQTMVDGGSQMDGKLFKLRGPLGWPLVHLVVAQILDRKKKRSLAQMKKDSAEHLWVKKYQLILQIYSSNGMVQNLKSIHILLNSTSSPACATQVLEQGTVDRALQ
jgi:hypothetical protein